MAVAGFARMREPANQGFLESIESDPIDRGFLWGQKSN